jgi:hypothetical protein
LVSASTIRQQTSEHATWASPSLVMTDACTLDRVKPGEEQLEPQPGTGAWLFYITKRTCKGGRGVLSQHRAKGPHVFGKRVAAVEGVDGFIHFPLLGSAVVSVGGHQTLSRDAAPHGGSRLHALVHLLPFLHLSCFPFAVFSFSSSN